MIKQLRNHLSSIFVLVFAIIFGVALGGCMPNAENEPGNGLSVGTLNNPDISNKTVLAWANEAATAVYNYDFNNYQTNLQKASQYFTTDGWQAYMTTLNTSGNLAKVIKNQTSVSAIASGTPVILSQGIVGGRYSWKIQLPLAVSYKSVNTETTENLVVTMLIVRSSPIEGVRGLGIKQFIALKKPELMTLQPAANKQ
jgi:hypothetical protein